MGKREANRWEGGRGVREAERETYSGQCVLAVHS